MEKKKDNNVRSNVGKMNVQTTEQIELKNFILVILVVVICVAGLYLVTRAFVTKDLIPKEEEQTVIAGEVNYDVAIIGFGWAHNYGAVLTNYGMMKYLQN